MKIDKKHIDPLIARYLSGEANPDERRQLELWMDASDENKKYFGDIRFVYDSAAASHTIRKFDVDSAWGKVKQQMHAPKQSLQPARVVGLGYPFWLKVAASIVVIVSFSLWWYLGYRLDQTQYAAIITQDSIVSHSLVDSTTVCLNRNSALAYLPGYNKKHREVKLTGEAYFDVKHEPDKPFIVKAEETFIKDIGTSFNVKAYPDSQNIEVFVETGVVVFYTDTNPGITLTQGETGIYNKSTRSFKTIPGKQNVISYKTKVFVFYNTPLTDVVQKLNEVYESHIRLGNKSLDMCPITVSFEDEEIERILGIIGETLELKVVKNADGYSIEGDGCAPSK